jgi:two-component system chemotaxis response regulator CheB
VTSPARTDARHGGASEPPALLVVGGSWGGFEAAAELLARVAAPAPVPVLLVLHRAPQSDGQLLGRQLSRACGHPVRELDEKEPLVAGTVHLAPPDYHVLVEDRGVSLSVEGPVNFSRPSVDLAFETAAREYGAGVLAVLLTGVGQDGAEGIAAVKRAGGRTYVQDPASCARPDMPRAALATGLVDLSAPVATLGDRVQELLAAEGA